MTQGFTLQMASNPSWHAVQALRDPFQMALALANAEDQDEAPAGKDEEGGAHHRRGPHAGEDIGCHSPRDGALPRMLSTFEASEASRATALWKQFMASSWPRAL